MKNKIYAVLLIVMVLVVGGWQMSPTKYEYKFEYNAREKKVNDLAAQGWELVAIDSGDSSISSVSTFVFKRAK